MGNTLDIAPLFSKIDTLLNEWEHPKADHNPLLRQT